MNCKQGTEIIIGQLTDLLQRLGEETYSRPLALFNGSSIGQHFRHIIDFYGCLANNAEAGRLDYAHRQRDTRVETEPTYAAIMLQQFHKKLKDMDEAITVEVVADFSSDLNETRPVVTSCIGREMMYAYDHAVHHLAIIKMGLKSTVPDFQIDKNIGVAPSTVKHWNR
jgi:hypothetical protein